MIEDWQYYHELGHGIIAHIFDGYLLEFKYLTIIDSEVKAQNFNSETSFLKMGCRSNLIT